MNEIQGFITLNDVLSINKKRVPYFNYFQWERWGSNKRREYFNGKNKLFSNDILLEKEIYHDDKLWLILRPQFFNLNALSSLACDFAEKSLQIYNNWIEYIEKNDHKYYSYINEFVSKLILNESLCTTPDNLGLILINFIRNESGKRRPSEYLVDFLSELSMITMKSVEIYNDWKIDSALMAIRSLFEWDAESDDSEMAIASSAYGSADYSIMAFKEQDRPDIEIWQLGRIKYYLFNPIKNNP